MTGSRMTDDLAGKALARDERKVAEAEYDGAWLAWALRTLAEQVEKHGLKPGAPFNYHIDIHPIRDIQADLERPNEGHHFRRTGQRTIHFEYWLQDLPQEQH